MKKVATLALAALTATTVATPAMARSSHQAHASLVNEIRRVGVRVLVNGSLCNRDNGLGSYFPAKKVIMICQENRYRNSATQVAFTEEDYDTLRHEAHHVVQDCFDRSINGRLSPIYENPVNLAVNWLGKNGTKYVANMYARQGASEHLQVLEVEAFAVARMNNPAEQIRDIRRFCF